MYICADELFTWDHLSVPQNHLKYYISQYHLAHDRQGLKRLVFLAVDLICFMGL